MFRILTALSIAIGLAGCWTPGSIHDGIPKHTEKFASGTSFFVEKTEPRVETALKQSLRERGFAVREKVDDADFVIAAKVTSWEFNDAGFSGFRDRDDMTLLIIVSDRKTKFIRARTNVSVRSDFGIIRKYVETL